MFKLKKTMTAVVLASAITGSGFGSAVAEQVSTTIDAYYAPIQFEFDSGYLSPPVEQKGFIYNDSTYVPLRFVAYAIDKAVDWDSDTYTVTIREPGKSEKVTISEYKLNRRVEKLQNRLDLSKLQSTSIPVYFESVNYVFDGVSKLPPENLPGLIYQDSLYVPLRFVSESVGQKIEWDPTTYTVKGSTPQASPTLSASPSPAPTPSTTPAAGGGGGYSGGGSSKPSQQSLFLQLVADLGSLEGTAQNTLTDYKEDYAAAATEEGKAKIEGEAKAYYDQVVNQFNDRVNQYEAQLIQNGYDTSSVNEIRKAFEDKVAEERSKIGK